MNDGHEKLKKFIQQHLPQCVGEVEHIPGSVGNLIFRLYLETELHPISTDILDQNSLIALIYQRKPTSLIAKLAFPHAVTVFEYPFPLSRQQTEKIALKLFGNSSSHPNNNPIELNHFSSILDRNRTIKIPDVLFHDEINNILILEDLGFLPTIEEWLSFEDKLMTKEWAIIQTQTYGEQFGAFIADMQIASLSCIDQLNSLIYNPDLVELIFKAIYPNVQSILNNFNVPDSTELGSVIAQHHKYTFLEATVKEKVLSHGDLRLAQSLPDASRRTLAVIDWEITSVNLPAYDVAWFIGSCYLATLGAPSNVYILKLMNSFIDGYREKVIKNEVDWYKNEEKKYLFAWSLGILHGFTLIILKDVQKLCCCENMKCCHRRAAVVLGADYIRQSRSGPNKETYDNICRDPILSRLFQKSE